MLASRPVAIPRRTLLARPRRHLTAAARQVRVALVSAHARARRPVLYLLSMAAACYGAWQIWHPLGWITGAVCGVVVEMLTGPAEAEGQG